MAQMAEAQSEARRIGEVIRQARVLQRRSQRDVAAALGYHQSKVSRLESGRGTEDVRVLREIAQVLEIPPQRLGLAAASDASPAEPGTEDMHRRTFLAASVAALAAPPSSSAAHQDLIQVLLPGTSPAATGQALGLDELRNRARAVRRMFCTCDYAELEQTLPGLIADLRQAAGGSSGSAEVSGLLATAYQTSVSLLLKRADQGNAWLAAGRAMAEAERSGDPVVLAASVRVHAHVLVREKHTAQAVNMVCRSPRGPGDGPVIRSPCVDGTGPLLLGGSRHGVVDTQRLAGTVITVPIAVPWCNCSLSGTGPHFGAADLRVCVGCRYRDRDVRGPSSGHVAGTVPNSGISRWLGTVPVCFHIRRVFDGPRRRGPCVRLISATPGDALAGDRGSGPAGRGGVRVAGGRRVLHRRSSPVRGRTGKVPPLTSSFVQGWAISWEVFGPRRWRAGGRFVVRARRGVRP